MVLKSYFRLYMYTFGPHCIYIMTYLKQLYSLHNTSCQNVLLLEYISFVKWSVTCITVCVLFVAFFKVNFLNWIKCQMMNFWTNGKLREGQKRAKRIVTHSTLMHGVEMLFLCCEQVVCHWFIGVVNMRAVGSVGAGKCLSLSAAAC